MDTTPDAAPWFDEPALRSAWTGWAARSVSADVATATMAADGAVTTVMDGGSTEAAVVAAFIAAGMRPAPAYLQALHAERRRLGELLEEIDRTAGPSGVRSGESAATWVDRLRRRQAIAAQVAVSAPGPAPAAAGSSAGRAPGQRHAAGEPVDQYQGVRILGATGVFLLIISTLLLEVFGVPRHAHLVRFGTVAVLELALFGVARACGRSDRFRVVMGVYLAAAALVLPLATAAGLAELGPT